MQTELEYSVLLLLGKNLEHNIFPFLVKGSTNKGAKQSVCFDPDVPLLVGVATLFLIL